MEDEMEPGVIKGRKRDPNIQIIPTLGPKDCMGLFGSLGSG